MSHSESIDKTFLTDRRKNNNMKQILIPLVVAVVVGMTSSYMTTLMALEAMRTQVNYIERDVGVLMDIMKQVSENQRVLAARGSWMHAAEKRIENLEKRAYSK